MAGELWTDKENDRIVVDYFAMLADDIAGRPYDRPTHQQNLPPFLNGRTKISVELKHKNISAALEFLGETWIPWYNLMYRIQKLLVDAVVRGLAMNQHWLDRLPQAQQVSDTLEAAQIRVEPSPALLKQPVPDELKLMSSHGCSA